MSGADDDAELLERARRGDQDAFAALIRPHTDALFAYLVRLTGDRDDAKDLLQDTLLRAWRALGRYRDEGKLASWLFTIAGRGAIDRVRADRTMPSVRLEHSVPHAAPSPLENASHSELEHDLCAALATLPVERRTVFLLRQHSAMTFREISDAMGIPIGTALSHMHHSVRSLREALRQHES